MTPTNPSDTVRILAEIPRFTLEKSGPIQTNSEESRQTWTFLNTSGPNSQLIALYSHNLTAFLLARQSAPGSAHIVKPRRVAVLDLERANAEYRAAC